MLVTASNCKRLKGQLLANQSLKCLPNYERCIFNKRSLLLVFLEHGIVKFLQRYLNVLVILLLAFIYWFNLQLLKYLSVHFLCRKFFLFFVFTVEGIRRSLFMLADFPSYLQRLFFKKRDSKWKTTFPVLISGLCWSWNGVCFYEEPLSHPATLFGNVTGVVSAHQIIKWMTVMMLDLFSKQCILFYAVDNFKYFNKSIY